VQPVAAGGGQVGGGGGGKVFYVGDSLGVGTSPNVRASGRNVEVGRTAAESLQILQQKVSGGFRGRAVFDAGTNSSPGELQASLRRAKRLGVELYVPTVNGPDAAAKNRVIRQAAGGNLHVVDVSGIAPGADGIHLTPQGYQERARVIQGAIGSAPAAPRSSGRYPLGKVGKVIGTPYSGTHAKAFNVSGGSDNWQSENAYDISIPVGTPVYAVADGVLGNTGSLGEGGRFAGLRTNLIGKGNAWYYAHLSKLVVKQGQRVRKGQLLGYSGEANGVAHLHFAQENGDPESVLGQARGR
jgi:murein DD-endopeptidase MepM/ murein hydrolase activator NlpD